MLRSRASARRRQAAVAVMQSAAVLLGTRAAAEGLGPGGIQAELCAQVVLCKRERDSSPTELGKREVVSIRRQGVCVSNPTCISEIDWVFFFIL